MSSVGERIARIRAVREGFLCLFHPPILGKGGVLYERLVLVGGHE